jgi:predicted metal-dependent hydrolase
VSTLPRRPTRPDHERRKQKALGRAVEMVHAGLYFEAHEVLEEVWLEEPGADFAFLQGLIQAAAAFHNLNRGKRQGPVRVLDASLEKLRGYGDSHLGVNLDRLRTQLELTRERARERPEGTPWPPEWALRIPYRAPVWDYS